MIGEPARAAMLVELMHGRALTATELAARAEVSAPSASAHLAKLVAGDLLRCEPQGRHRYYRLAGPAVAHALEALGVLARPFVPQDPFDRELYWDLRHARTCYDHLAGQLGVAMTDALLARDFVADAGDEFELLPAGEAWFGRFGIDVAAAKRSRRAFARRCLDWSERRPHLAGALGAALLGRVLQLGWIERRPGERSVGITARGEMGFMQELEIRLEPRIALLAATDDAA